MKRCLLLVEGQTEELFVRQVLQPHMRTLGIDTVPTVITTKRVLSGPDHKGSVSDYERVDRQVRRLLGDTAATVSTMLDYYGLPRDFPGMSDRGTLSAKDHVVHIERKFGDAIANDRFIPNLMLHEFEALVFADLGRCSWVLKDAKMQHLQDARRAVSTPEDINDNPATAPSKRLRSACPGYDKSVMGPMALKANRHRAHSTRVSTLRCLADSA